MSLCRLGLGWCLALLFAFALDAALRAQFFDTAVVSGLLAPSTALRLSHALLGVLFLLNRVWLYVVLPALACAAVCSWLANRLLRWAGAPSALVPPAAELGGETDQR